jgi:cell wall-associated NlpC family hydrolase
MKLIRFSMPLLIALTPIVGKPTPQPVAPKPAEVRVSGIDPGELVNFQFYPLQIKQLVRSAMALTKLGLGYSFGSADPKAGGMDCSGTIHHLLVGAGLKGVPRQSDEMCDWVGKETLLHLTANADTLEHAEFAALQPGDLVFWSGTYEAGPRNPPVTHVMLYLGRLKTTNEAVVFGASDGRYFQGVRHNGVSVFDFVIPKPAGKSRIHGYGLIPGVGQVVESPRATK